jgi:hypothetical protein
MREEEIVIDKVITLLDEDLEAKSGWLMEMTQKDGSEKIAVLLKSFC